VDGQRLVYQFAEVPQNIVEIDCGPEQPPRRSKHKPITRPSPSKQTRVEIPTTQQMPTFIPQMASERTTAVWKDQLAAGGASFAKYPEVSRDNGQQHFVTPGHMTEPKPTSSALSQLPHSTATSSDIVRSRGEVSVGSFDSLRVRQESNRVRCHNVSIPLPTDNDTIEWTPRMERVKQEPSEPTGEQEMEESDEEINPDSPGTPPQWPTAQQEEEGMDSEASSHSPASLHIDSQDDEESSPGSPRLVIKESND